MSSTLPDRPPNPRPPAPKSSLTVSQVIAGAGAAATAAVVGSAFGADGTVVGAAVGAVVSAVAAAAYERSLDRTRRVVVARVRRPGDLTTQATQVLSTEVTEVIPAQRVSGAPVRRAPVPSPRRTRLPLLVGATVVIFLVGLLAVTGIELLTGGPVLSSQRESGTSVGRVLGYGSGSASTTTGAASTSTMSSATTTATASASASRSDRSDGAVVPSDGPSVGGSAGPSARPAPGEGITATPTAGALSGLGASDRSRVGG